MQRSHWSQESQSSKVFHLQKSLVSTNFRQTGTEKLKGKASESKPSLNTKSAIDDDPSESSSSLPTANDYFRAGHSLNYHKNLNRAYVFGGYNGPNELYVLHNARSLSALQSETADAPYWEKG